MPDLDLRPLSLGEILDRTFTLYRRNFVLFLGIASIPHLGILAVNVFRTMNLPLATFGRSGRPVVVSGGRMMGNSGMMAGSFVLLVIAYFVAYLFSHGGTVCAVSELYLGRTITMGEAFRRTSFEAATLSGVLLLNSIVVFGPAFVCVLLAVVTVGPAFFGLAVLLFLFPGVYMACRLIVGIPAALLENIGPRSSLERSFHLTKGSTGRAFLIYLLYVCIWYAAILLLAMPFGIATVLSAKNPSLVHTWAAIAQVGNYVASVLVSPILTIAASVFYYDLRVRKEAFDLQLMMNPTGIIPTGPPGVPSMFS